MSVEAVRAAFEHSTARPTARLVLLALAEAANRDEGHETWLAVDTIRQRTGLDRRNVQRALRDLEAADEIGRVGGGAGGRSRTTRYRILLVERAAEAPPIAQGERAAVPPIKGGGDDVKGGATAARSVKNRKEPARASAGASAAPRGQHHNNGGGIPGAAAYAGPLPCTDCGTVTNLHQGRCDPCYERWADTTIAAAEAYEAAP